MADREDIGNGDESQDIQCSKCKELKPLSLFHNKKDKNSGKASWCKECISTEAKRHYKANKEKILNQHRVYNQDNKEATKLQKQKHYQKNREKIREKPLSEERRVRDNNRKKEYRKTEIGKRLGKKHSAKRRAVKNGCHYEEFDLKEIFERDGYMCQLCGKKTRSTFNKYHPLFPQIDHIVPLSKGGNHTRKNTQCLCRQCNLEKWSSGTGDQLRMFG